MANKVYSTLPRYLELELHYLMFHTQDIQYEGTYPPAGYTVSVFLDHTKRGNWNVLIYGKYTEFYTKKKSVNFCPKI